MAESVKASEDPKVASDVIEGEAHQRVKIEYGADGSATDVSATSPLPVGGGVAHDAADAGSPVKTGARARTSLPTAVSNDDRVDAIADKFGRRLVAPAPLEQRVSGTLNRTDNSAGQILAAVGSTAYVVTAIQVTNAHASVGTKVEILDGESVKWKGYACPAGGGFSAVDPNGLFVGTANTKLQGKCATTGADVDISISAYKVPA